MENRLTGVTGVASFVYDGDGKRVKKTETVTGRSPATQTTVYVNKYYEKNLVLSLSKDNDGGNNHVLLPVEDSRNGGGQDGSATERS